MLLIIVFCISPFFFIYYVCFLDIVLFFIFSYSVDILSCPFLRISLFINIILVVTDLRDQLLFYVFIRLLFSFIILCLCVFTFIYYSLYFVYLLVHVMVTLFPLYFSYFFRIFSFYRCPRFAVILYLCSFYIVYYSLYLHFFHYLLFASQL